jgi:hypothetical protein
VEDEVNMARYHSEVALVSGVEEAQSPGSNISTRPSGEFGKDTECIHFPDKVVLLKLVIRAICVIAGPEADMGDGSGDTRYTVISARKGCS